MGAPKTSGYQTAGSRVCEDNGWDFTQVFHRQFRLSREAGLPCPQWHAVKLGKWHLHHCPALDCHDLCSPTGKKLGVLLGIAVDAEGRLVRGRTRLKGVGDLGALERYIESLAGRFLVILNCFDTERVYFDPSGGLSAVYSPADNAVASSVHVLIGRELEPNESVTAEQVMARQEQFLLGETCDRQCRRIRANHYLDLADMSLVRHWPRDEDSFGEEGMARPDMVSGIAGRLEQIMGALAGGFSTALPVSGGTDSRLLLAASRDHLDGISHFYVHDIRYVTKFDRLSGERLTRHLGVPYLVIDSEAPGFSAMSEPAVAELRRKMAYRTSLSFDGINDATVRAVSCAPAADLVLRGNMAEMTRANKWNRRLARQEIGPEDGLMFLTSRRVEDLRKSWSAARYEMHLAGYQAWIDSLPESARQRIPDLAHMEVFGPAAPNNVYYAFDRNFYINPYNDRRILHLTARFHPLARMKRRLVNGLLRACMPDLADLPYGSHYYKLFREARLQGIELSNEL